jgi:hypothetical protein
MAILLHPPVAALRLESVNVKLGEEEIKYLEEQYAPNPIVRH